MKIPMALIAAFLSLVALVAILEKTSDRMMDTERWRRSPLVSRIQSLSRGLLVLAVVCLISGLTLLISNQASRLRRQNK